VAGFEEEVIAEEVLDWLSFDELYPMQWVTCSAQ
jgi:hypothetical protein